MRLPRAPWWMYLLASCLLVTYCLNLWTMVMGPEAAGFRRAQRFSLQVGDVLPDRPLAKAGVQSGDVLVAVDDLPLNSVLDWDVMNTTFELGTPFRLDVRRGQQIVHLTAVLQKRRYQHWTSWIAYVEVLSFNISLFSCLILALLIAFRRPFDLSSRLAAWLLGAVAVFSGPSSGSSVVFRNMPAPVAAMALVGYLFMVGAPTAFPCFFATFPRRLLTRPWHWIVALSPGLLLMIYASYLWSLPALFFGWQPHVPQSHLSFTAFAVLAAISLAEEFAGIGVLIFNALRVEGLNERRKIGMLAAGVGLGWIGAIIGNVPSQFAGRNVALASVLAVIGSILFLAFPLSFAYAILRHRIFDLGIVVRRGLQYALARDVLKSIPFVMGLIMGLDFLFHRNQTVSEVLGQRGWLYLATAAISYQAHRKQASWLEALDRRFFRERYNAQQILREVAEEIRSARSFDAAAPTTVARIEAALHAEFAAVLVRDENAPAYRCLASSPANTFVPVHAADSKLMGAFRLFGKPLELAAESGWLKDRLPHEETEFLRQAPLDLLVPISLGAEAREALLALGPKKSEEPYGSEDRELLLAIAHSLALVLEPSVSAPHASSGMEECPRCGACYDSGVGHCHADHARLASSPLPRVLDNRYRLDRRLGQGGMGTVYRVHDSSLDRDVALKLIRDHLVASADAEDRFRREARAAAAITHPNLVTIHDFAVDANHRAYLVMELLSGMSLRTAIQSRGRISPAQVLDILRGVCAALTIAHERGLVHRDLKPENIFLAQDQGRETPKVLDFGLAKFTAAAVDASTLASLDTGAGVLVGTPQYMSPEQLHNEPVSAVWDLWALAVTTYEMLTGKYPFAGTASVAALHAAILAGQFTPVLQTVPDAPPQWNELFLCCLAPEVSRRPSSAGAFLAQCEQLLASARAQEA